MFSTTCFLCLALLPLFAEAGVDGYGAGGIPAKMSTARQRPEAMEAKRQTSINGYTPTENTIPPKSLAQDRSGLSPSPQEMNLEQGLESHDMPSDNTIRPMLKLLISSYSRLLTLCEQTMLGKTSPSNTEPQTAESSTNEIEEDTSVHVENELLEQQKRQAEEKKNQLEELITQLDLKKRQSEQKKHADLQKKKSMQQSEQPAQQIRQFDQRKKLLESQDKEAKQKNVVQDYIDPEESRGTILFRHMIANSKRT